MRETRFIVAACPVCRRAFGMERRVATVTCPRCFKRFPSDMPRKLGEAGDQRELAAAVAQANAALEGGAGDEGFRRFRREGGGSNGGGSVGVDSAGGGRIGVERERVGAETKGEGGGSEGGFSPPPEQGGEGRTPTVEPPGIPGLAVDGGGKKKEVVVVGGKKGHANGDIHESIAYAVRDVSPQKELAMAIATELTDRLGEFTAGHFAMAAERAGLRGDPDEWLERMALETRLVEPSSGNIAPYEQSHIKSVICRGVPSVLGTG